MVKPIGASNLTIQVQERNGKTTTPALSPPETQDPFNPITVSTSFAISTGGTIQVVPSTRNNVTAVSAFASLILSRDDDLGLTGGTLIAYAGQGSPPIVAPPNTPTGTDLCTIESNQSAVSHRQGCRGLYIAPKFTAPGTCPANLAEGDSHWKYVIAHEFGHVIQDNFGVFMNTKYVPTVSGRPAECRCDHVLVANQWHCMQSLQRASDSQIEAFAHFYAASVWNSPANTGCSFAYYKEFLVKERPSLPDGDFRSVIAPPENTTANTLAFDSLCVNGTALPPGNGGASSYFSILPPMLVDCSGTEGTRDPRRFVNYRTQAGCWPATQPADYSTEFDWLKFYFNLSRSGDSSARVSMTDLLNLYKAVCPPPAPNTLAHCVGSDIPQLSTPGWDEMNAAAQVRTSPHQATAFRAAGQRYGVNGNL